MSKVSPKLPRSPPQLRHVRSLSLDKSNRSANSFNDEKLVDYVISAQFDNKIGAIVKHQIPRKIPGFKENLSNLADLMLPTNTEHNVIEDYSVFILYKDSANKYRLLPESNRDILEMDSFNMYNLNINGIDTIYERNSPNGSSSVDSKTASDVLFFLNVTKVIEAKENERGALIKAIAIGTPLKNFIIFKHLITITLQSYIRDNQISHLISLFNLINYTDISIWKNYLSLNNHLSNILSLNYVFNTKLILSHFNNISTKDMNTQLVRFKNGLLQFYSNYDITDSEDSKLKQIPMNFSLVSPKDEIVTDLPQNNIKILKFLNALSIKLNEIDYRNLKIIIHSQKSTDQLCQFILSLSNYLNGLNNVYFHNDKILYFPLIDLYSLESLIEFDKTTKNSKMIGTNNRIIKENVEFYDLWYDLDTEQLDTSEKLKIHEIRNVFDKTHDFNELVGLLIREKHDANTTKTTLKRFNIWQVLKILSREDLMEESNEINLQDYYLSRNKNIVLFGELFDFKTIRLLDTLHQFIIISPKILSTNPHDQISSNMADDLILYFKFIYSYISPWNSGRLEMFVYLLEIFPINVSHPKDLLSDVGIETNSTKVNLLNLIFKPIFIKNHKLQKLIWKLYDQLNKSSLKIVLENRLNLFTKIALDEFGYRLENTKSANDHTPKKTTLPRSPGQRSELKKQLSIGSQMINHSK